MLQESGGNPNALGDKDKYGNFKSIGLYQIQKCYWKSAAMPYGSYADCKKKEYAEQVILKNWKRYVPNDWKEKDFEGLARFHNGWVNYNRKPQTKEYWRKVKSHLPEAKKLLKREKSK
jgi:hypothetical protein